MKIGLKLLENDAVIQKRVLKLIKDALDSAIKRSIGIVSTETKNLVRGAIVSSDEYRELLGGELQAELGVADKIIHFLLIFQRVSIVELEEVLCWMPHKKGGVFLEGTPAQQQTILLLVLYKA